MAYASFIGFGAIDSDTGGAGAIQPVPPDHKLNDILICAAENQGGSSILATPGGGWTFIKSVLGTAPTAWYWTRASSAGISGPALKSADTDLFGVVAAYRGVVETDPPFEASSVTGNNTDAAATPSTATITTLGTNRLVVHISNIGDDTAWTTPPPPTGWSLSSIVSIPTGTDVQFVGMHYQKADASSVVAIGLGVISAAELWSGLTFALISAQPPTVTTSVVSNISSTTATGGGNVTADGGSSILQRGVAWATTASPTTANNFANTAGWTGFFQSSITGLTAKTSYYAAAFAINAYGSVYGTDEQFSTGSALAGGPSVAYQSYTGAFSPLPKRYRNLNFK